MKSSQAHCLLNVSSLLIKFFSWTISYFHQMYIRNSWTISHSCQIRICINSIESENSNFSFHFVASWTFREQRCQPERQRFNILLLSTTNGSTTTICLKTLSQSYTLSLSNASTYSYKCYIKLIWSNKTNIYVDFSIYSNTTNINIDINSLM